MFSIFKRLKELEAEVAKLRKEAQSLEVRVKIVEEGRGIVQIGGGPPKPP